MKTVTKTEFRYHTVVGDLFDQKVEAICLTTNGFVRKDGKAVMGRGVAAQAVVRWPVLPYILGHKIRHGAGNVVQLLTEDNHRGVITLPWVTGTGREPQALPYHLVSLPVKPMATVASGVNVVKGAKPFFKYGDFLPGWAAMADPVIIQDSIAQLLTLVDEKGWAKVALPIPGTGAGELPIEVVLPLLAPLDARFLLVTLSGSPKNVL